MTGVVLKAFPREESREVNVKDVRVGINDGSTAPAPLDEKSALLATEVPQGLGQKGELVEPDIHGWGLASDVRFVGFYAVCFCGLGAGLAFSNDIGAFVAAIL